MSKKLFILPTLLLVASTMFVSSCKKDCSFKQADYIGSYGVSEDCSLNGDAAYIAGITVGASETDLKFINFWGLFLASVDATIDCETINIPRQEPDGDGYFVEGSGTIEKNSGVTTVSVSYTVTKESVTPIVTNTCTATFIQQ